MTVSVALDARVKLSGYQEQSFGVMVVDESCGLGLRKSDPQLIKWEIVFPITVAE